MPLPDGFDAKTLAKLKPPEIKDRLIQQAESLFDKREKEFGADYVRILGKSVD